MRFKRVYIEITNTCNLACSFCIQNSRPAHRMSIDEFKHVIKEVKPYTKHVYFHVLGEPLSHPDLATFLQICKEANIEVIITTNGTLLKKQCDVLANAGCIRQLNVSLHSFPQHEQPNYLKDVFASSKILVASGIHVNYRLWSLVDQHLTKETQVIFDKIKEYYQVSFDQETLKRMMRIDLADHLHLHFETIFTWPSLNLPYLSDHGTCLGMKTMCGILSDGSVVPCCLDTKGDMNLGNIFQTPLKDIVESKRCEAMRIGFQNRKLSEELCKHCSYRLRFDK